MHANFTKLGHRDNKADQQKCGQDNKQDFSKQNESEGLL